MHNGMSVVYAYAKILILKQITTLDPRVIELISCICLCKDTNFKANHNQKQSQLLPNSVVYAYAKILILKQITTSVLCLSSRVTLYMPMQRY